MTIFYPDVSHYQAGLRLEPKTVAVVAKATEGRDFVDPAYADFKEQSAQVGAVFAGYHFLWPHSVSDIPEQARHAFSVVGADVPLMVDAELESHTLSVGDIESFVDEYRALGGKVRLLYLPHWYWRDMGSPSLQPLVARHMLLVASEYRSYVENAWPGGYGGMEVYVWQYTDGLRYADRAVDFNACRDSVEQFATAISAHVPSPPKPHPAVLVVDGKLGPKTITRWQQVMGTVQDGRIDQPPKHSQLVEAVQRHLNAAVRAGLKVDGQGIVQDGHTVSHTTGALQRYLGTPVDGKLSLPVSQCVEALQRRLNAGHF